MNPFQRDFFLFYALVAAGIVLYIKWDGRRRESRLHLTETEKPTVVRDSTASKALPETGKQLNVIFQYNGHDWDAFEVLGVPAGSSQERVQAAYQQALSKVDAPSRIFIETAYRAICDKMKF